MNAHYIAAIDQGTTSTRCILFDRSGQICHMEQMDHRQIMPRPGWVEHDPVEIWQNSKTVLIHSLDAYGIHPQQLAALGVTNQRETTVIWERSTGKPLHNAIVWQDTRTTEICDELAREGGQDRFRPVTGLPISPYFSGTKVRWLLEHDEKVRRAVDQGEALFGTIDTWLLWNFTGGPNGGIHLTDVTNASRTLLMSLEKLRWEPSILETMGIPGIMLPEIRSSSSYMGETAVPFSGIPVCSLIGDQQAALFGQACYQPGEAKNTYGTGCFMLMNTGQQIVHSKSGLLTTVAYRIADQPPVYGLEGSIAIAGALVQWLRDNLGLISSSAEIESLARSVEDNGGVYIVPAFSGLFAPYWRSDARGVIAGLTRYASRPHLARAALEATAYQTFDVLKAMENDSNVKLRQLKVDGGMVVNNLLMQFQADILDVPVTRPGIIETTALGAAYTAGLAAGFWESLDELREQWQAEHTWQPQMLPERRQQLVAGWEKAVQRTLGWVN